MRVWIEIAYRECLLDVMQVSPSYEGVDWNAKVFPYLKNFYPFHPLMRVWIEIASIGLATFGSAVSPSYEGVDWNLFDFDFWRVCMFHPLMRVWIEINLYYLKS